MVSMTISVVALLCSIIFSIIAVCRSWKKDTKFETEERTTIIVKLENIGVGVNEIKSELKSVREEIKDHESRIIKLEAQSKEYLRNI